MYNVIVGKSVQKKLYKLPAKERERIFEKMKGLASDPRPPGYKKLTNREQYRIRIGDYQVIYNIDDKVLKVLVIDVDHRRQVYD